jgi:muramoyltetrapeptide carboxypeptidase
LTLFIDPPNAPGHGRLWAHLASDTSYDELHRFAQQLGIPQRGFDRDHYDVPAERYQSVVAMGVVPVSSRELIERLKAAGLRRRKAEALAPKKPGRSLIRAPRLRRGDHVAVVAPAGPVRQPALDAGLDVLRSWGLEVDEAENARGRHGRLGYLAADDAARAHDLTQAWSDPDVAAVFCARGGYGTQRMVDLLDWQSLAQARPKALVGFSDITSLHQAFAARLGLSTIHGPSVSSLASADEESRGHLRSMLLDPAPGTTLTPSPARRLVGGRAEGVLVGGNLALLAAGIGTGGSLASAESIVVLEEVGEAPYRLDRMLTQLLRAGWFDGARGIVVGGLTDCGPAEDLHEVLADRLVPLGLPMVVDAAFGHARRNLAFPLGVPAVLDADAGTLVLRDAALV